MVTAGEDGNAGSLTSLNKLLADTDCVDGAKRQIRSSGRASILSIDGVGRLTYRYQRIRKLPFQETAPKSPEIVTAKVALYAIDPSNSFRIREFGNCTIVEMACRERDCIAFTVTSPRRSYQFSRGLLDIYFAETRNASTFVKEIAALIRQ